MIPSALTRLIVTPAPLSRGVATISLLITPSFTLINSWFRSDEYTFLASLAFTIWGMLISWFKKLTMIGLTTLSKAIKVDTGYPGSPIIGVSLIFPMIVGLPGLIPIPWTYTIPFLSIIDLA